MFIRLHDIPKALFISQTAGMSKPAACTRCQQLQEPSRESHAVNKEKLCNTYENCQFFFLEKDSLGIVVTDRYGLVRIYQDD